MKKIIVITTINSPTIATKKFAEMPDWQLVVVGDTKTPHNEYEKLNCIYLHPDDQEKKYKELSDALGWKTIRRRNIGFLEAYNMGADVMATVDDDNIPYDDWGQKLYVGQEISCDLYSPTVHDVFDPLSVTNVNQVWHRGYPIEYVPTRFDAEYKGKTKRKVLVQADLWDGDPDIDAMARLTFKPVVKFDVTEPYCSEKMGPFNSQNTFIARKVIPYYFMFPFIGRMDDIWASYIAQHYFPNSVIYNKASVYQDRNVQDLIKNLEDEIIGYRNTLKLLKDLNKYSDVLPDSTKKCWEIYRSYFKDNKI
jgi:hypothetical protein